MSLKVTQQQQTLAPTSAPKELYFIAFVYHMLREAGPAPEKLEYFKQKRDEGKNQMYGSNKYLPLKYPD
jgi:hypothetical protein